MFTLLENEPAVRVESVKIIQSQTILMLIFNILPK